jgi:hypothetical protein
VVLSRRQLFAAIAGAPVAARAVPREVSGDGYARLRNDVAAAFASFQASRAKRFAELASISYTARKGWST